ncbi:peptidoglycan-binding protein [Streptomyces sp. XY431]|uniref:peptidoglycan-binding domain-containing protein n=1 Tax=Streptomyces sp. XY431 TaxID=1415562 RepID=UPI0006AE00D1|nr:peptidoglycan-binding protein [Streptomyces sp. XY431]
MADVKVMWTGLECQIRQEAKDEVFGTIQLIAGMNPQPVIAFPDGGNGRYVLGPPGQRMVAVQQPLYSGPAQDLTVSATLVEFDSGDVTEEKKAISVAVSKAATAAVAVFAGGGVATIATPLIGLLSEAFVNLVADLFGIKDDAYNPGAIALSKDQLLSANSRRQVRTRPDDPRTLQFTDTIVLTGVDDAGDIGKYAFYLDVQTTGPGSGASDGIGTPTLSQGSQGEAVRKLQRLLNEHVPDLPSLAVDGDFGPATDARAREYQRRVEIIVDGIVGPQTWGMLTDGELAQEASAGTPTLQQGSHGPAVRKLQRLLNDHLPDLQLAVDGRFGPVTDGRVREFQQRVAIAVDGIVGPQTWGHLTQ